MTTLTASAATKGVDVDALVRGVLEGNRTSIAKAITLVESTRADHQVSAQDLLVRLTPHAGDAIRIGISGVPGAGKSTFIDALGTKLTEAGHRVAVLAVDPSSSRTGGSILGDKTRMARLAYDEAAFIRPSPTSGTLGGVARATREAIVVVEAAGYDVVLVETVGVGQSETAVADMVDDFLVLLVARTGDSLQGIKKGILELADVVAVNKADGDHITEARAAARELSNALHLIHSANAEWIPPVLTCSAVEETGLDDVWEQLLTHRAHLETTGELSARRRDQQVRWMWATVDDRLRTRARTHPGVLAVLDDLIAALCGSTTTPTAAAMAVLDILGEAE